MPHFGYLPPATAAQAASVYALLHVTPRMLAYSRIQDYLAVVGALYGLFVVWIVLQTGLSAALRDFAARIAKKQPLVCALYWILLGIVFLVLSLPLDIYSGFALPHQFGLSHESFGAWSGDYLKDWGVGKAIGVVVVMFLIWLIRRSPGRWPYWFAGALIPFIAFGIFLSPLLFDPLFNKFTPLPSTNRLYSPLHLLADRAGIPKAEIFEVDKSKQTDELNAYVTGLGSSARIVIWDTVLAKMPPDQVEAITGHEMGHYVEYHIWIGFGLTVIGLFVVLPITAWGARLLVARFGAKWKVTGLADPAALPALMLVFTLVGYVTDPISNAFSREIEHRADAYGLGLTHNRVAMARSFITLAEQDLDEPYPPTWVKLWLTDHPPLGERIRYALYGQPDAWP